MSENLIKVAARQQSSDDCFVCGMKNPLGFRAQFYEMKSGELVSLVTARDEYQSYPGRLHGGISSTLLDEVMGRAILLLEPSRWGVTVEMETRYHKPVPLGETLRVVARVTSNRHIFESTGEIIGEDGTLLVSAHGRYMKLPVERITGIEDADKIMFDSPVEREVTALTVSGPLKIEYAGARV